MYICNWDFTLNLVHSFSSFHFLPIGNHPLMASYQFLIFCNQQISQHIYECLFTFTYFWMFFHFYFTKVFWQKINTLISIITLSHESDIIIHTYILSFSGGTMNFAIFKKSLPILTVGSWFLRVTTSSSASDPCVDIWV